MDECVRTLHLTRTMQQESVRPSQTLDLKGGRWCSGARSGCGAGLLAVGTKVGKRKGLGRVWEVDLDLHRVVLELEEGMMNKLIGMQTRRLSGSGKAARSCAVGGDEGPCGACDSLRRTNCSLGRGKQHFRCLQNQHLSFWWERVWGPVCRIWPFSKHWKISSFFQKAYGQNQRKTKTSSKETR